MTDQPWTSVDIPEEYFDNDNNDEIKPFTMFLESVIKITFAGFSGALVGLSYQRGLTGSKIFQRSILQHKQQTTSTTKALLTKSKSNISIPRRPPPLAALHNPGSYTQNLPAMWAGSFMIFVTILETSRVLSPTTKILQALLQDEQQKEDREEETTTMSSSSSSSLENNKDDVSSVSWWQQPQQQLSSITTILDFTLGGTVAGLAGSMAKRSPPISSSTNTPLQLPTSIISSGRRSLIISGIGTGMVLGCFAGLLQACIDQTTTYIYQLQEEQERQEELEQIEQEKIHQWESQVSTVQRDQQQTDNK